MDGFSTKLGIQLGFVKTLEFQGGYATASQDGMMYKILYWILLWTLAVWHYTQYEIQLKNPQSVKLPPRQLV
jgi:glycerol-3-phosphate acyltransferase PlsY